MIFVCPVLKLRAMMLGRYPSSAAASRTRAAVVSDTDEPSRKVRLTADWLTPANLATSIDVARFPFDMLSGPGSFRDPAFLADVPDRDHTSLIARAHIPTPTLVSRHLKQRESNRHDNERSRRNQQRQADRARDEDVIVTARQDKGTPEVLLQHRSEDETEHQGSRLETQLEEKPAKRPDRSDDVDVERVHARAQSTECDEDHDRGEQVEPRDRQHLDPDPDQRNVQDD